MEIIFEEMQAYDFNSLDTQDVVNNDYDNCEDDFLNNCDSCDHCDRRVE